MFSLFLVKTPPAPGSRRLRPKMTPHSLRTRAARTRPSFAHSLLWSSSVRPQGGCAMQGQGLGLASVTDLEMVILRPRRHPDAGAHGLLCLVDEALAAARNPEGDTNRLACVQSRSHWEFSDTARGTPRSWLPRLRKGLAWPYADLAGRLVAFLRSAHHERHSRAGVWPAPGLNTTRPRLEGPCH